MSAPIIAQEFAFAFGPSVDGVVIDTGEPPGRYINNIFVQSIFSTHFEIN